MDLIRKLCRRLSPAVLAAFGLMTLYIPVAQAGAISPSTYAQQVSPAGEQRQQLAQFLEREDVRAQLISLGVEPAEAQARVARLSDQEAATAAARMQELPAGGNSFIGAVVFIFLVLLITDILGFTNVYPFVKSTAR
ncbi:MAG: PA2779 family protein [Gammaproteobacteria bacterium]